MGCAWLAVLEPSHVASGGASGAGEGRACNRRSTEHVLPSWRVSVARPGEPPRLQSRRGAQIGFLDP